MASGVLPSSAGVTSKLFMPRSKQTSNPQEPLPPPCDPVVTADEVGDTEHQDPEGEQSCAKLMENSTVPCLDFEAADDADLLEACRQFDCAQPESAAAR